MTTEPIQVNVDMPTIPVNVTVKSVGPAWLVGARVWLACRLFELSAFVLGSSFEIDVDFVTDTPGEQDTDQ